MPRRQLLGDHAPEGDPVHVRARLPGRVEHRERVASVCATEYGNPGESLRPMARLSKVSTRNARARTGTVRHHPANVIPRPMTSSTAGLRPWLS